MQRVRDIEGIDDSLGELLEAAGFIDVASIAQNEGAVIHSELLKANAMLQIVAEEPTLADIEAIRHSAYIKPAVFESIEEDCLSEKEDKGGRSFAIPLSQKFIAEHQIDLKSLPSLEQEKEEEVLESSVIKAQLIEDYKRVEGGVRPLPHDVEKGSVRVTSMEANKGVSPSSKKFIRGVMHVHATSTYVGAIGFIVTVFLLCLSVLPVIWVIFHRDQPAWAFVTPALLLLTLLVYTLVARKSYCPVCRQKQFAPKSCRKHVKAHQVSGIGYMLPTALHLVAYKWFRCIFCGTSIRVKQ